MTPRNRDLVALCALAFLAPVLSAAGAAVAERLGAVAWPILCWRHGWQDSPCPKCAVWTEAPYSKDQSRADRAELRAISKLLGAESGKQSESG